MKCGQECLNCIDKQIIRTLELLDLPTSKSKIIEAKTKDFLRRADLSLAPIQISQGIFELIQHESMFFDPYHYIKEESNKLAQTILKKSEEELQNSKDPLFAALNFSLHSNIIDYGPSKEFDAEKTIVESITKPPFINDYKSFLTRMEEAKNFAFICDNAGEIVFDLQFVDEINRKFNLDKISLIVKQHPILNDITLDDMKQFNSKLSSNTEILAVNNSYNSKSYLKDIKELVSLFDVTVSKGQGNFELLYDSNLGIYFAFIVKCSYIGDYVNAAINDTIFHRH